MPIVINIPTDLLSRSLIYTHIIWFIYVYVEIFIEVYIGRYGYNSICTHVYLHRLKLVNDGPYEMGGGDTETFKGKVVTL